MSLLILEEAWLLHTRSGMQYGPEIPCSQNIHAARLIELEQTAEAFVTLDAAGIL